MADPLMPAVGATPVTDRRPQPRGVLPRRIQAWVLAAVAGGMVLIMVLAGRPDPLARRAAVSTPAPQVPSPDRLRDYQDRLRIMESRVAQQAHAAAAPTPTPAPHERVGTGSPDPITAERKRREYDSLFASNVVLSRRPADQQPTGNGDASAGRALASTARDVAVAAPTPPNVDDVASAVVRATAQYTHDLTTGVAPGAATTPLQPTPATSSTASAVPAPVPPAGQRTPAGTEPIRDTGPLHRLLEGTVIDTVLTNRLDGSMASPVNCLVTNPIYSHSGQQVLIPAGSRVLGETKAVSSVGESRLAVAFHRLLLPDGRTVSLDQFTGLNQLGDAALRDQVNHHYFSTFGAASAVGVIGGLGQYLGTVAFGGSGNRTIVMAGGFGNATSEATAQVMNRFLNRLPTITIREGHRVEVYLTSDLELPAYEDRTLVAAPPAARVRVR